MLFSVKDLASAAQLRQSTAPPAVSPLGHGGHHGSFGDEPTGMVDLRKMASSTHSSLAIKPMDIAALRPSVVPMPVQHASSMWPSQDKPRTRWERLVGMAQGPQAPLFFGGLAVVALLFVGFGAALTAWALSGDAVEVTASVTPAPATDAELIEREIVQRTKVAEDPEAAAPVAAAATHGGGHHGSATRGHGGHAKSSSKTSSSKTSSTPKKASDPCNCHGVLACAMRCTK